jgi:hypothetical protein
MECRPCTGCHSYAHVPVVAMHLRMQQPCQLVARLPWRQVLLAMGAVSAQVFECQCRMACMTHDTVFVSRETAGSVMRDVRTKGQPFPVFQSIGGSEQLPQCCWHDQQQAACHYLAAPWRLPAHCHP